MGIHVKPNYREKYLRDGFVIFEKIVPEELLGTLRKEANKGLDIARTKFGPSARRLQPVTDYPLDLRPFLELMQLPALNDALHSISPDLFPGMLREDQLADTILLFVPVDRPRCNYWHRDWKDRLASIEAKDFHCQAQNINMFNAYTCSLYPDPSLWVVPGSHKREDSQVESALTANRHTRWEVWDQTMYESAGGEPGVASGRLEQSIDGYCRAMPGWHQIQLEPGDFLLWSAALLHLGRYSPEVNRASVHGTVGSDEYVAWMRTHGPQYLPPVVPI